MGRELQAEDEREAAAEAAAAGAAGHHPLQWLFGAGEAGGAGEGVRTRAGAGRGGRRGGGRGQRRAGCVDDCSDCALTCDLKRTDAATVARPRRPRR